MKKKDINTVQGVNEHIIITQETNARDTCKNIVNDLTSPEGKLAFDFLFFDFLKNFSNRIFIQKKYNNVLDTECH